MIYYFIFGILLAITAFLLFALVAIICKFRHNKQEFESMQTDMSAINEKLKETNYKVTEYNEDFILAKSCKHLIIEEHVIYRFDCLLKTLNESKDSIEKALNNTNDNGVTNNTTNTITNCLDDIQMKAIACNAVINVYNTKLSTKITYSKLHAILNKLDIMIQKKENISDLKILYTITQTSCHLQHIIDRSTELKKIIDNKFTLLNVIKSNVYDLQCQATRFNQSFTKRQNSLLLYIFVLPIVCMLSFVIWLICLLIVNLYYLIPENMQSFFIPWDNLYIDTLQKFSSIDFSVTNIIILIFLLPFVACIVYSSIWLIKRVFKLFSAAE